MDPDAREGQLNVSVEGVIRIRGVEQQLALDAQLAAWENGYVLQCQFDLDRTHFGAIYGSGRFFAKLGKHLVNDLVSVQVNAVFKPRV
ncbi:YceI family protein [Pelagicoccus albus]|uniref:YceI family protein n=1 Tax=Pelagicoccus albus TaxID=415222 RepID=A0A7X1B4P4_9BACT|nr:YceI family protein [Pelagicoccus albus]